MRNYAFSCFFSVALLLGCSDDGDAADDASNSGSEESSSESDGPSPGERGAERELRCLSCDDSPDVYTANDHLYCDMSTASTADSDCEEIGYSDCISPPSCPEGTTEMEEEELGEWDYECHFCGPDAESDSDAAHDGGVEDHGCRDTTVREGEGHACDEGGQATVVGLSECESVPACAE